MLFDVTYIYIYIIFFLNLSGRQIRLFLIDRPGGYESSLASGRPTDEERRSWYSFLRSAQARRWSSFSRESAIIRYTILINFVHLDTHPWSLWILRRTFATLETVRSVISSREGAARRGIPLPWMCVGVACGMAFSGMSFYNGIKCIVYEYDPHLLVLQGTLQALTMVIINVESWQFATLLHDWSRISFSVETEKGIQEACRCIVGWSNE